MHLTKKILSILILLNISSFSSATVLEKNNIKNLKSKTCIELVSEKSYQDAFSVCNKSASSGSIIDQFLLAELQFNLGNKYRSGQGVLQDYKQAVYWYQKAAEQGFADAQFNLGLMYDKGLGVLQDYKQAAYWYQKTAEQGDAEAQNNLGGMYDKGQGVLQDYKQAVYWYQKAADQGNEMSQYSLGRMYYNGQGVVKDYEQAAYWFQKSADKGDRDARIQMAIMYYKGIGVIQNYKKSFSLYQQMAEEGDSYSEFRIGMMYFYGIGVNKDNIRAYAWTAIASKYNSQYLVLRDKILKNLTSDEVNDAQYLAQDYYNKYNKYLDLLRTETKEAIMHRKDDTEK